MAFIKHLLPIDYLTDPEEYGKLITIPCRTEIEEAYLASTERNLLHIYRKGDPDQPLFTFSFYNCKMGDSWVFLEAERPSWKDLEEYVGLATRLLDMIIQGKDLKFPGTSDEKHR